MAATSMKGFAERSLSVIRSGGVRVVAALAVAGGVGAGERAWGQQKIPTFKPPATFNTFGVNPFGLAAGDIVSDEPGQLDGYPDVVVANGGFDLNTFEPNAQGTVTIFRNTKNWNNPANGLEIEQIISFPNSSPRRVALVDMTGNGVLDLVVSASVPDQWNQQPTDTWGVYVFINNGGTFSLKKHVETPMPVSGLAVADFDNDGLNDVAVCVDFALFTSGAGESDFVYVLQNNPNDPGDLLPKAPISLNMEQYTSYDSPTVLLAGDFHKTPGAPRKDIVAAHFMAANPSALSVLTGLGSWQFSPANHDNPCAPLWTVTFFDAVTGRFTSGSLQEDIAAIQASGGSLHVLHGNVNGTFNFDCTTPFSTDVYDDTATAACLPGLPMVANWRGVALGSLNGGTKPDLVTTLPHNANESYVTLLLGNGDGTFQYVRTDCRYHVQVNGTRSIQAVCADLTQSGFDDIIVANHDAPVGQPHTISVLINKMTIGWVP